MCQKKQKCEKNSLLFIFSASLFLVLFFGFLVGSVHFEMNKPSIEVTLNDFIQICVIISAFAIAFYNGREMKKLSKKQIYIEKIESVYEAILSVESLSRDILSLCEHIDGPQRNDTLDRAYSLSIEYSNALDKLILLIRLYFKEDESEIAFDDKPYNLVLSYFNDRALGKVSACSKDEYMEKIKIEGSRIKLFLSNKHERVFR